MKRARPTAKGAIVALFGAIVAIAFALSAPRGLRLAHAAPPGGSGKPAAGAPPTATPASKPVPGNGAPAAASAVPAAPPAEAKDAKAEAEDLTSLPLEMGLPVTVRAAVYFIEAKGFDDTKGEFEATTDVRLKWSDSRLRLPPEEAIHAFKEWRFSAADKKLETIWSPQVDVENRIDAPSQTARRLRITVDGDVELITRTTAKYKIHVDAARFPFDRQHFALELVVREHSTEEVDLEVTADDVEWSRAARDLKLDGWTPGIVDLNPSELGGWNGDRYARLEAALDMDRDPMSALAPVFIPLVASLLIPLLATWMNKTNEEGDFEIEAFELANVVIGGLFSVIALSFAIYSAYGVIAGGDNTVTRLFALNYVSLACALGVVVLFFRFNLPKRLFGPYVQAEMFRLVLWALPLLSTATAIAFILAAKA